MLYQRAVGDHMIGQLPPRRLKGLLQMAEDIVDQGTTQADFERHPGDA